jgi:hypothetical protein
MCCPEYQELVNYNGHETETETETETTRPGGLDSPFDVVVLRC